MHKQVIELIERVNLLLSMKERANGAYYLAYDHDTAISIVNSQSESETVSDQSRIDLSILLSEMNTER